jgi:hypothetical protein
LELSVQPAAALLLPLCTPVELHGSGPDSTGSGSTAAVNAIGQTSGFLPGTSQPVQHPLQAPAVQQNSRDQGLDKTMSLSLEEKLLLDSSLPSEIHRHKKCID